ncbi:MAG: serine/threonine protein kinase [Planctomycetaceae bacterium]
MAKRKFGPFEIQDRLGSGGMGVVYRAVYAKNGKTVALKVLPPEVSLDDNARKRFAREMEILQRLDHKHIVKYYGGGTIGQQHFYAMELLHGGSLEDVLKMKGRLPWEQVIEVGKGVARALEHAHSHGIVHRDLKPANLFLSDKGLLKLGDFGIARDTGRTALTAAGKTVGTYAYMAPEQISGKPPVSQRTDQYALGCVLFELLTGKTPFEADNPAEMLMQHIEMKPPRVTSMCEDCPIWFEAVINRLLEKDPEDRYFDSLAVYTALKEVGAKVAEGASIARQTVAGGPTLLATRPDPELRKLLGRKKKKRRKRQPFYERAWFLAACLVLLIGGVTWAVWPMSDEERFRRGKQLMDEALALAEDDAERALKFDEARTNYFEPLMERDPDGRYAKEVAAYLFDIRTDALRRQAEKRIRRKLSGRSPGEKLYMNARIAEIDGDRALALDRYKRLIPLVGDDEKDRPYVKLAQRRREAIFGGSKGAMTEMVQHALKRADTHIARGETIKARELWNAIVSEFGENQELAPLVDKAREKLAGKKSPRADGKKTRGAKSQSTSTTVNPRRAKRHPAPPGHRWSGTCPSTMGRPQRRDVAAS